MIYIKKMFMQVYAALYHAFMPPHYAGTLYQGLYQVYATRAPIGFIPEAAPASRTITSGTPVLMNSVRPWPRGGVSSGTSFLMNPVLPAYFITAYAVALFCFMLVLCNARDLSWLCLGPA